MEKLPPNLHLIQKDSQDKIALLIDRQPALEPADAVKQEKNETLHQMAQKGAKASKATSQRRIDKKQLINKINYVNFQDEKILIAFKHKKYLKTNFIKANPQPCYDENLTCLWADCHQLSEILSSYAFDHILIPDGLNLLLVQAELLNLNEGIIHVRLPDEGYEISSRKFTRHRCEGISACVIQNSTIFKGELLDFNAVSFRVYVHANPPQTFKWLNLDLGVSVIFSDENETLYTGSCTVIHQTGGQKSREFVLEPITSEIQRFKHKEYRSLRHTISPPPTIVFKHPFTGKLISLKAIDLSGSGFSVEEDVQNAVLLPGLMIPEMELSFYNNSRLRCKAQLIYRHPFEKDDSCIKCGVAILDMDIEEHVQLLSLLQHAENTNSYICNKVDLDQLWDFFFETGFIYPHKYNYIQKNKHRIKKTYEKLYTLNPNIAHHFIYQDKGRILAHMAMVRFYMNTWMIHHHAARKSKSNRAGLKVLKQIGDFGNDSHSLCSINMDFLMCYYRPENKFPKRVFGSAVKNINKPKGCSEDLFAYFHFRADRNVDITIRKNWELAMAQDEDLRELGNFYEHHSGGLMLDALNLEPGNTNQDRLVAEYRILGFKRERHIYALRQNSDLIAIVMLNLSDIGLNLSDLTNSIKVIVIDSDKLSKDVLYDVLCDIVRSIEYECLPVMIYPKDYMDLKGIPFEKLYNLWIINLQNTDDYFRYLNRLLRFYEQRK